MNEIRKKESLACLLCMALGLDRTLHTRNEDLRLDYVWQSQVEIEHYSVAYFERITVFEAL